MPDQCRFYVYTLSDPRDGLVFYVGKGKGRRAWEHESQATSGRKVVNGRKIAKIKSILNDGLSPHVQIVARYDDEQDAFEHEAELISATKGLLNILARGGGWALAPEEIERRRVERRYRISKQKHATNLRFLKRWAAMANSWEGVTFPGLKDGEAKAMEFLATVNQMIEQAA